MPLTAPLTLAIGEIPRSTLDFLIVFATATVVTLALRHLRVATIPAFLLAGAIIGPALQLVPHESVDSIASLAIILLMFGIGLQMDMRELRGELLPVFCVGGVATVVVTVLAWPVSMLFGLSPPAALAMGMAISMTSTAAVMRTFQQRHEGKSFHARISVGVSVAQDLLSIAFLALIPTLARWHASSAPVAGGAGGPGAQASILALLGQAVLTIVGVAVLIAAGRVCLPRLLSFAAKGSSPDVLLVVAGAVALASAAVTAALGLSPELGAFVAGFMLAGTPFKYQVSGQLTPMRDLFMAIFFVAVGLNLPPLGELASLWWVILLGTIACVVVKTVGNAGTIWLGGLSAPVAVAVGMALSVGGEFGIVLLQFAKDRGLVDDRALGAASGVVAISLMLTPILITLGKRIGSRLAGVPSLGYLPFAIMRATESHEQERAQAALADTIDKVRVIIAGFGPVGRAVAQRLDLLGAESVIIELNPNTVKRQGGLGRRVVYGDVNNPEVLESAGIRHADAFILTIPDDEAAMRAVRTVRDLSPGVYIAVRSSFLSKGLQARQLGANAVTIEEIATAESMAEQVHAEFVKRRNAQAPEAGVAAPDQAGADVPGAARP